MSVPRYLPIISSLETNISARPFSFNFCAIIKFSLSPLFKNLFLVFESIKSCEILIGRL